MIRTARALPVLLLLGALSASAPLQAQEARTHEVVRGETLSSIAQSYYGDGSLWRLIYDANQDRISDPAVIDVGLVLTIPPQDADMAGEAEVTGVTVMTPEEMAQQEQARPRPPQEARGPKPVSRTVMWRDTTRRVPDIVRLREVLTPVARDEVYSAAWLRPWQTESPARGEIAGFVGAEERVAGRVTTVPNDRVRLAIEGAAPPVGTVLQVFREDHLLAEGVGVVMIPTGTVEVVRRDQAGVTARVRTLFEQMELGDLVREVPPYPFRSGQSIEHLQSPSMEDVGVVGFAQDRAIYSLGDVLFLDVGAGDGVRIGDEYGVVYSAGEGWEGKVEGRAVVVLVGDRYASARITAVKNPVFEEGVRLHLTGRLR